VKRSSWLAGIPERDRMFVFFTVAMFIIMLLYGAGMVAAIFFQSNFTLSRSLISGFASMFAAWVGLGSGYILGRKSGGGDA
jgi:hypothetical protein